jgi:hypothetical protein
MSARIHTPLCSTLVALMMIACGDDDGGGDPELRCGRPYTGEDIAGEWSLEAHGERTECSDRRLLGDLAISTPQAITVKGMKFATDAGTGASESDAFVNRIVVRAGYELSAKSVPAAIEFEGSSDGACVTFTLIEDLGRDELRYHFDGHMSERGYIEGDFTGTGPDDCETHGTFTIEVR